jgi:hypothetical protein
MKSAIGFVLGVALCLVAGAQEAVFDAARPDDAAGLLLVETPDAPVLRETVQGAPVVSPSPNVSDYLNRRALEFRVPDGFAPNAAELFLVVEHLDTGLGLIQVTYAAATAQARAGYAGAESLAGFTRLDSQRPRRALFRLGARLAGNEASAADIRIAGAAAVRRVVLKTALAEGEADAFAAEIPATPDPRVTLSRPLQLVMSVGADASTPEDLPTALRQMRELCPLAATLGFTGVESYVKWSFVEPEQGRFDWSFYDAVVQEAARHNLRWFPLLIVGSAYTLPTWYHDSPKNVGFACLEHGKANNIQSIFCEHQTPHVQAFLNEFGRHYEPGGRLLGVRLGPSGNYGESQYPAGGNWGYGGKQEHIHIGWWADDVYADAHFGAWLRNRYGTVEALNKAWNTSYAQWGEVTCFIPQFAESPRQRKDFVDWYMGAMSDWCERWALWARDAMPNTSIYQSAGGWGFVESGTDFTDQTRSMTKVKGGIRATNETDSYSQNFQVTRMMSSAARFYGVPFGSEPAGFNSAKGIASRIYNILVNDGQHLFFYNPNLLHNDQAIDTWLDLAPLLDRRSAPIIDVAVLYPDTQSKLDDGVFRNLYASSFYQRIAALRPHLDFDYCSERMVLDGALDRYKVLVLAWSPTVEADTLAAIERWVAEGGTVLVNYWNRTPLQTVEGDRSVLNRWLRGDAGKGKAVLIEEDREPPARFADRVRQELLAMENLHPHTQAMLRAEKPDEVYVSALESGVFAVLNYSDAAAEVRIPGAAPQTIPPYRIALVEPGPGR